MPRRHLLLSTSRTAGTAYLEHAADQLEWLLGERRKRILFIPYAAVRFSYDDYESMVAKGLPGHDVVSIHHFDLAADAFEGVEAIALGGGNTFQLVSQLYTHELLEPIRKRAQNGVPFLGWSAGSNVAGPKLSTTNDMPIVEPPSFQTLGLIPVQINPHYLDAHPDGHMGETREERIEEFIALNSEVPVIGLREGAMLKVDGNNMSLEGSKGAGLFRGNLDPQEFDPGADLSFLL